MLRIIEDVLTDKQGWWPWVQNEYVLEAIEKAGMLPPTIEDKSFKLLENGEMVYQVNEWEPES
jgi:hypothetical protein